MRRPPNLPTGHRRVDRRVPDVRLRRPARVRPGQLRVQVRRPSREAQEAAPPVGDGAREGAGRHGSRGGSCRSRVRERNRRQFGLRYGMTHMQMTAQRPSSNRQSPYSNALAKLASLR